MGWHVAAVAALAVGGLLRAAATPRSASPQLALGSGNATEEECLAFLVRHQPPPDARLPPGYLADHVRLALEARAATPWAAAVPKELFLNYVLPYANFDEQRDAWRGLFRAQLAPLVAKAATTGEAALILNSRIWALWDIVFLADQTPAIMSPFQVLLAGHASCTGLSIFLVNALRSVGVPARVAGIYEWETAEGELGNHSWVEAWDGEAWGFLGASEPDPRGFNHTWFYPQPARTAVAGSRKHAIYATSWAPTPGHLTFPVQWNEQCTYVNAYDVTEAYTGGARTAVQ